MKLITNIIICLLLTLHFNAVQSQVQPTKLSADFMMAEALVDSQNDLKFGWQFSTNTKHIRQSAYQLMVSNNTHFRKGDLVWDSGKINSDQSQLVTYKGQPLASNQTYFWKVRIWTDSSTDGVWSAPSQFHTTIDISKLDAKWIGAITRTNSHLPEGRNFHTPTFKKEKRDSILEAIDDLASRSIMLRKEFPVQKKIKEARLLISGLGHYKLSLNGQTIGNSEFAPLWSDYDKTVYYNTYDVSEKLSIGNNCVGVVLGNGMYNVVGKRYSKFYVSFGPPTLFLQLNILFEDGTKLSLNSNESWKFSESPITFNSIFGGEDYDANLIQEGWDRPLFDESTWQDVVVQNPPKGTLRAQIAPAVKVMDTFGIASVTEPLPNTFVFDMGQNLSGFPTLKVKGVKGKTVRLWVAEKLSEDGTISQSGSGKPYYYEYTCNSDNIEEWTPSFSYYGYQYIMSEGATYQKAVDSLPKILNLNSNFLYNSAGTAGNFECSNELFNKTHELINNAIKSNFHSVFTDCPHREKLGWLEETHLNGPGLMYNYNLQNFIPKVMRDIADAQRENGLIPNIAPEYIVFGGDFTDSPEWGAAGVILPWMYYDYYGDPSLISEYYEEMKSYVEYLKTTSTNHIVSHGLGDWYDYGEHAAGYSKNSPIALSATSHYYFATKLLADSARLLNKQNDARLYTERSNQIKKAFNDRFFKEAGQSYATGSQFSNAMPLFLDLVPEGNKTAVLKNLVKDIASRGYRLTTGDVGNRYLFQVLARNGENETLYKMLNHDDVPGYGFQIQFGLTTLTEQWDPRKGNSLNHFMMGQIEEWFYRSLAGIVPDEKHPGFKHFFLEPELVGDLSYVKANYESIYGNIHSSWQKNNDQINYRFVIPANTSATVKLPRTDSILEINGKIIDRSQIHIDDNKSSFKLNSGSYDIKVNL